MMRIVFMGTPDFAVESLKAIVENNFNVVGVITAPDKPAGRGQKVHQPPIKEYAVRNNLKVLQPTNLKAEEFVNDLRVLKADLQVVVAFRMLPDIVWSMPRLGTFNLHGSLLPHYRGAAPINWAVINGDKETGVTTFFIQQEIDTGSIIYQEKIVIDSTDNAGSIHDKLMAIGARLVVKTVKAIEEGNVNAIPQNELKTEEPLKPAPKIFKNDCLINWNNNADTVYNFIRGLAPYPGAWFEFIDSKGKKSTMKIFESELINNTEAQPGSIDSDDKTYITIGCKGGVVKLKTVQLAGKKRMKTDELLRGYSIKNASIE